MTTIRRSGTGIWATGLNTKMILQVKYPNDKPEALHRFFGILYVLDIAPSARNAKPVYFSDSGDSTWMRSGDGWQQTS